MHDTTELGELTDSGPGTSTADRSRWMALVVLCTGMLMIVLDATIVNVALPSIQSDLGFSATGLAWVVNAYLIAFGGLLLFAGRVGRLGGARNVFLAGLAVFTVASMVCGLARTQEMLVGAQFAQGIGGALTSAVILGVIVTLFPEPRDMAKIAAANLIQVLSVAGMFGVFFLGALYLRRILGYSPLEIGLAFLPVAVVMGALSVRYTDRLVMRFGARATIFPGLGLIAAGLALFATAPAGGGGYLSHIFPVSLLVGAGAGLCFPALMTLAMSSATPQDAGLASGLVNTTAQIGGALGLAVLATVSASRSNS